MVLISRRNRHKFSVVKLGINHRSVFIPLLTFLVVHPGQLLGQDDENILGMRLAQPTTGFSLETADFGNGASIFFSRPMNANIQWFGQFKVMDVTGEAEMPVVDYWTGFVYKANPFNLWLMPAFVGIKYHPFIGRIANNFSPFAMVATGPVIIMDVPETGKFAYKMQNIETTYNGGFVLGAGIDFMMQPGRVVTLFMGYDHIRIGDVVHGRKHYGGTVFKFMVGRRFK
jgi:hypothetical protein